MPEFLKALWEFGESVSLLSPEEFSGISYSAKRATRSMQLGTPGYTEDEERSHNCNIRIILILLRIFKVRSNPVFWTSEDGVGEKGFIPPCVEPLEEKRRAMQIDGKEHKSTAKVEVVNGEVKLQLYPYGPGEECAFELVMEGKEAQMLGTWLLGKGRQATNHHKALNKHYGTATR